MGGLAPLLQVAIACAGLLVLAWLGVSFTGGAAKNRLAWLATLCMYVGFASFFTHLFLGSMASGSWPGRIGFGFLMGMFCAGVLVATVRTLGSLRSAGAAGDVDATH